jgi:transporter family protein
LPAEEAGPERGVSARSSGGDRTKKTGAKEIRDREIFMTSSYVWFHWALLSAVFASLTAIFAKIGLEGVDSDFATMIRTFIILFSIVGFVYYTGKWSDPRSLQPRTWIFLTLSGLATGASWVCYFRALQLGDAAKVAPVDKLSVLLVAVFAVLFLGERPPLKDWLGICLVASGVIVLGLRR